MPSLSLAGGRSAPFETFLQFLYGPRLAVILSCRQHYLAPLLVAASPRTTPVLLARVTSKQCPAKIWINVLFFFFFLFGVVGGGFVGGFAGGGLADCITDGC